MRLALLALLALLTLTACGGADAPTTPAVPTGPTVVRVVGTPTFGAARDQVTLTIRNAGGPGQYRIRTYEATGPGRFLDAQGSPIGPLVLVPLARCESTPALISPAVSSTMTLNCARGVMAWVTVEVQDGSSPAWVRTACVVATGAPMPEAGAMCTTGELRPAR